MVNNLVKVGNVNQINQLERDEDVVAQAQAIAALKTLPQLSFSVTNAMNNFLNDTKVLLSLMLDFDSCFEWNVKSSMLFCSDKAFWRVRIETAFALANTASEVL